jgi:hypothetical protein
MGSERTLSKGNEHETTTGIVEQARMREASFMLCGPRLLGATVLAKCTGKTLTGRHLRTNTAAVRSGVDRTDAGFLGVHLASEEEIQASQRLPFLEKESVDL